MPGRNKRFFAQRKNNNLTTPVTLVGDTVIVGFDEEKLRKALGI